MAGNIGELNVRIGGEIKGLEAAIRRAERALDRAGQTLSAAGDRLTMSLTLPIVGLGVASIKSAGEIEQLQKALETTMKDAGRSTADATKELDALRKAAEAPGLDFQQAVKGSVRLQNVGFSAEKARGILVQLANAVAMSGGSAQELDGVTRQFGQMIAKGRVLQEDLTIIQENMPAVSAAMEKAFGTRSAEKLRDMGVSAEQFVDGITKQLALLPRVEGGITNAIVNAGTAIKLSLAKVGMELNKTFNVTGNLDRFADWIVGLADRFAKADEGTKKLIIGVGLFAAALGPAVKAMNLLVQGSGFLVLGFTRLQVAMKTIQTVGIAEWFVKLDKVTKATVWGAIAAAVLAAALAFKALEKDMSSAAQIGREVENVNTKAAQSIVEEKMKVEGLVATLKNHNASRADQKAALEELQRISPKHFANLDKEKFQIGEVVAAQNAYIDSIFRAAKAQAAREKIVEIEKKLLDTQERLNEAGATGWQTAGNVLKEYGKRLVDVTGVLTQFEVFDTFGENQTQSMVQNLGKQTGELITMREAMKTVVTQNSDLATATKKTTDATNNFTRASKEAAKTAKQVAEVMGDWKNALSLDGVLGEEAFDQQASAVQNTIKKLLDLGLSPLSAQIQQVKREAREMLGVFAQVPALPTIPTLATPGSVTSENTTTGAPGLPPASAIEGATAALDKYKSTAQQLGEINTGLQEGALGFGEAFQSTADIVARSGTLMQQAFMGVGAAINEASTQGASSFAEIGKAALGAAAKVVRAYIQQGVAAAAFKALQSLPFPFNIAAAAAAGGLAGALFNKLISSVGIPALAGGGITQGPMLAMIGDNPGGREVVLPLDRLDSMLRGGGDGGPGQLVAQVRGDDLYFIWERQTQKRRRTR